MNFGNATVLSFDERKDSRCQLAEHRGLEVGGLAFPGREGFDIDWDFPGETRALEKKGLSVR